MEKAPLSVFIIGMAMSVVIIIFGVMRVRAVYKKRNGK